MRSFHASSASSNTTNPRKLWTSVNKILHRKISNSLPTCPDSASLSLTLLLTFSHLSFTKFILIFSLIHLELLIYLALILLRNLTSACLLQWMRYQNLPMNLMTLMVTLILFLPLFLRNVNLLYFQLSPISSIIHLLVVFFLINLDLAHFILSLTNQTVIKMTCLIIDLFLSLLSKLTERVVKNHLTNFTSATNLLNSSQSACTKYHSTETTLLAVHDHVIRAISQQQITRLVFLTVLLPLTLLIILF
jgi:hypothetical protein